MADNEAMCFVYALCVFFPSATGTAELLNHEQEEVDRILANVSPTTSPHTTVCCSHLACASFLSCT